MIGVPKPDDVSFVLLGDPGDGGAFPVLRLAAAPAGIMIEILGTQIRAAEPDDRPALEPFLARWHSLRVARRGGLVHPLDHPGARLCAWVRTFGLPIFSAASR